MDRAQKAESIETLKGVFADAGAVVVTHNLGLTVADMEDLRGRLRKEGGTFKVVKNRLALKALEADEGSDYHGLFKGPVGIAYADDAVTAAKITAEYAKANDKFIVLGGFMGEKVLDAKGVETLSKLPSLDQIRASLLGLPITAECITPAVRPSSVEIEYGDRFVGYTYEQGVTILNPHRAPRSRRPPPEPV